MCLPSSRLLATTTTSRPALNAAAKSGSTDVSSPLSKGAGAPAQELFTVSMSPCHDLAFDGGGCLQFKGCIPQGHRAEFRLFTTDLPLPLGGLFISLTTLNANTETDLCIVLYVEELDTRVKTAAGRWAAKESPESKLQVEESKAQSSYARLGLTGVFPSEDLGGLMLPASEQQEGSTPPRRFAIVLGPPSPDGQSGLLRSQSSGPWAPSPGHAADKSPTRPSPGAAKGSMFTDSPTGSRASGSRFAREAHGSPSGSHTERPGDRIRQGLVSCYTFGYRSERG